ncbi:unnamed protein product [Fusarium equiseti]|uniref:Uncharacterized protein n=1 Tax=Fusarium equiseti TaxID=61235 RepID=A0A8J2ITA9_FUSEQ|nr:unnamed protein product [Fusarium equiseti]
MDPEKSRQLVAFTYFNRLFPSRDRYRYIEVVKRRREYCKSRELVSSLKLTVPMKRNILTARRFSTSIQSQIQTSVLIRTRNLGLILVRILALAWFFTLIPTVLIYQASLMNSASREEVAITVKLSTVSRSEELDNHHYIWLIRFTKDYDRPKEGAYSTWDGRWRESPARRTEAPKEPRAFYLKSREKSLKKTKTEIKEKEDERKKVKKQKTCIDMTSKLEKLDKKLEKLKLNEEELEEEIGKYVESYNKQRAKFP